MISLTGGWLLFALSVSIFILFFVSLRLWRMFSDAVSDAIFASTIIAVFSFVLGVIVYAFIGSATGEQVIGDERELVALAIGSDAEGRFFLGTGYSDDESVYSYMYRNDDGGIAMSSVPVDSVTIYETTDGSAPRIEAWYSHSDIAPDISGVHFWPDEKDMVAYNVYIPEGSVWQGYSVDVRDGS